MSKFFLAIIAIIFICGCGVNVTQVRSRNNVSTGWYNEQGLVTTDHGTGDTAEVQTALGYHAKGLKKIRTGIDIAVFEASYTPRRRYGRANVGDTVLVSTLRGTIRVKIIETGFDTFLLEDDGRLVSGDSGAPVTTRTGRVVGMVRARVHRDGGVYILARWIGRVK